MEKVARNLRSRPRSAHTHRVVATLLALSAVAIAQQAESRPSEPGATAPVERLTALVAEAESLLEQGNHADTRSACRRALAIAEPRKTDAEFLAACASALWQLGVVASLAGDSHTTHDAWKAVHDHLSATLPDDHPNLQTARGSLAAIKYQLGDLGGARALQEKAVAVFSASLAADDIDLQRARFHLANTQRELGDLQGPPPPTQHPAVRRVPDHA